MSLSPFSSLATNLRELSCLSRDLICLSASTRRTTYWVPYLYFTNTLGAISYAITAEGVDEELYLRR
jgi:hypothetical protein